MEEKNDDTRRLEEICRRATLLEVPRAEDQQWLLWYIGALKEEKSLVISQLKDLVPGIRKGSDTGDAHEPLFVQGYELGYSEMRGIAVDILEGVADDEEAA